MSAIKVLIVEDEELYADKMEMLLDKMGYSHQATVADGEAALRLIRLQAPDLILMDIYIQGKYDGVELADLIHRTLPIPIIFVTSLQDDLTFRRAQRTGPVAFLLKPFSQIQLQRSIELAVAKLAKPATEAPAEHEVLSTDSFFIRSRNRLEKIHYSQLTYLEADGRYCYVYTADKRYHLRSSLTELVERLSRYHFVQTHRSFVVNMKKVSAVDLEESVVLLGDQQVALSKRNREEFVRLLDTLG